MKPFPRSQLPALSEDLAPEVMAVETQDEISTLVDQDETRPVEEASAPLDEVAAPDMNDIDAAMAWMEALAAKQGADEESLKISTPEERSETPPEWIQQAQDSSTPSEAVDQDTMDAVAETLDEPEAGLSGIEEGAVEESEEQPEPQFEEIEAVGAGMVVEEVSPDEGETVAEEPVEAAEDMPSWVTELSNEPEADEMDSVEQPVSTLEDVETPAEMEVQPGMAADNQTSEVISSEDETTGEAAADIPDWLRSYEEEQKMQEPVWLPDESFKPEAVSEEQLPDWLLDEPVAQSPDASEMPEPTPPAAADVLEPAPDAAMPGWLKELQDSSPDAGTPAETSPDASWQPEYQQVAEQDQASAPPMPVSGGVRLELARASLRSGDIDQAVAGYNDCINAGESVAEVIDDLKAALDQHPIDIGLWQALGDAYMREDHIQDALDAYTKAEELLR